MFRDGLQSFGRDLTLKMEVLLSGQYITAKLLEYEAGALPALGLCAQDILWIFGDLIIVQISVNDFHHH